MLRIKGYNQARASWGAAAPAFGACYPEAELIVTLSFDEALKEVREFVGSLPDVCYERDLAS